MSDERESQNSGCVVYLSPLTCDKIEGIMVSICLNISFQTQRLSSFLSVKCGVDLREGEGDGKLKRERKERDDAPPDSLFKMNERPPHAQA